MISSARPVSRCSNRHRIDIPCEVITNRSDREDMLWATDMSDNGMWLESKEPLAQGEELVLCFRPGMRWRAPEIHVFASVARISRGRRDARDTVGMGVRFLDLSLDERWNLRRWLQPRPIIAPSRRGRGLRPRRSTVGIGRIVKTWTYG